MQYGQVRIPTPELNLTDRLYLQGGMIPGYRRVWRDGIDVTDEPVSAWPQHAQHSYANGWRPIVDLYGTFMD